jgi:hypothetical protein
MNTKRDIPAPAATRYARADDVVARTVAGEHLLVPIRGRLAELQRVFAVNAVGQAVWDALERRPALDEVVASVAGRFECGEEDVAADVRAFLAEMGAAGLVRPVG